MRAISAWAAGDGRILNRQVARLYCSLLLPFHNERWPRAQNCQPNCQPSMA
jgi:hypothetical protein